MQVILDSRKTAEHEHWKNWFRGDYNWNIKWSLRPRSTHQGAGGLQEAARRPGFDTASRRGFVTVTATVTGAPLDKLFVHVRVTQN